MDVKSIARALGIRDNEVIGKAQELMRLATLKISGGLGPGEVCKAAVCLELACGTCSHALPPSRDMFVRHSCATKKVYMTAFGLCQKVLGAGAAAPTLQELALKCGCESLAKPAEVLLALYRKRFMQRLAADAAAAAAADSAPPAQSPAPGPAAAAGGNTPYPHKTLGGPQQPGVTRVATTASPGPARWGGGKDSMTQADFSRPAFALAALQLTATAQGWGRGQAKLDVRKALQQLGVSNAQYQPVVDSIRELCAAELGVVAPPPQPQEGEGEEQGKEGTAAAPDDTDEQQQQGEGQGQRRKRCRTKGRAGGAAGAGQAGSEDAEEPVEEEEGVAGVSGGRRAAGRRPKQARKGKAVAVEDEEEGQGEEGGCKDGAGDETWEVLCKAGEWSGDSGDEGAARQKPASKRPRQARAAKRC